jgi:hypothetical protein
MVRLYHLCIFSPVHKYDVAEPGYSTAENDDNQEFLIHQILEKKKPTRLGAASGFGGVGGSLQGVFFRCSFAGKEWDILVGVIESVHPVDDVDGVLFELVARRRERRVIDLSLGFGDLVGRYLPGFDEREQCSTRLAFGDRVFAAIAASRDDLSVVAARTDEKVCGTQDDGTHVTSGCG